MSISKDILHEDMSPQAIKILISVASGTLALSFNALLAVIILKTHCSFIGSYKYLLFLYTVSAIMYSIAQVTTAANFLMFSDGYMFYDTFRILPPAVGNWAVDLYSSSFIQNMIILTLSFAYRYLVICNPRGLEVFTRNWVLITAMCIAILGYFVAAMVYVLMPSPLSEEVFGKRFYQATGYNVTDTAYNAGIVTIHGSFNWMLLFALGPLTTLIVVSITIIVVVAVKTARKLKATSTDSKTMAEHQRKIFTLLIFQITLPMFFNIFPVQFAVISTFFQLPTDFLVHNIGCVLTIAQIIDPLLVFYFIKPYRQALLRNDPSTGNGQPHVFMNSNGYLLYDSRRLLPTNCGDILLMVYSSCFCQNLVILTHCFIFRYYAVCKPESLASFVKHWPKITVVSMGILVFGMGAIYLYSGTRSPEYEPLFYSEFLNFTGYTLADTGYLGVFVYGSTHLNFELLRVVSVFVVTSSIAFALMARIAFKIAVSLKNYSVTSLIIARQQKKIFVLLLYQLFMPLVFSVYPQNFIIFSAYFRLDSRNIVPWLCCILTVAQHVFMISNGYLLYDSLRLLPPSIGDVLLIVYTFCFFQIFVILTLCFIFRYYAVCKPESLDNFVKHWPKITVVSVGILVFGSGAGYLYSGTRSSEFERLFNSEFFSFTGYTLADTGYWGIIVYSSATQLNFELLILVSIYVVTSSIAFTIMARLAFKIAASLKSNSATSEIIARQQKRIFVLLLYQLFMPLFFGVLPQNFITFSAYFRLEYRNIVHWLCCILTVAQVIDPLMTFYLIKPYRAALFEQLQLFKNRDIIRLFSSTVIPT